MRRRGLLARLFALSFQSALEINWENEEDKMPLTTDDVVSIQTLAARYNHAADSGDGKAFASTFAAEGKLIARGSVLAQGTSQLIAFAEELPKKSHRPRHVLSNVVVAGDGDDATLKAYVLVYSQPNDQSAPRSLVSSGIYSDVLHREDGAWLFTERTFVAD